MTPQFEILDARDLLAFPSGDNTSDTVFAGVHFNLTTLNYWNYTFYSNQTLSNGSRCWLTFEPYQPQLLLNNGTFVNATRCWSAIDPIGTRGVIGIVFAVLYGIALVLSLAALAKHGTLYLPKETRFYPIGRRWQWYWAAFICTCALVSLLANIDVDRYYIQELPIVLTCFFWFLICQGTLALTWEAARHWGSWLERQYVDPNPFVYREDDRRAMVELWLPLWFYFWVWMNFFLVVPRGWSFVEKQRSTDQTLAVAIPTATGGRFKGAGFCLFIAWLTIIYSLRHSVHHYKPRNRGLINSAVGFARALPWRFYLLLPLSLVLIAYQVFMSFVWEYSVLRYGGVVPVIFAWGYGPSLLIVCIQLVYGFSTTNEDKQLMRQRRERGEAVDRELGIVKPPAWWRRVRGDHLGTLRDKIQRNVSEVGGERGVGRRVEDEVERHARQEAERSAVDDADGAVELRSVKTKKRGDDWGDDHPRADRAGARLVRMGRPHADWRADREAEAAASLLFPGGDATAAAAAATTAERTQRARREAYLMGEGSPPPPPYSDGGGGRRPSGPETLPELPLPESLPALPLPEMLPETPPETLPETRPESLPETPPEAPPQQVRSMLDV